MKKQVRGRKDNAACCFEVITLSSLFHLLIESVIYKQFSVDFFLLFVLLALYITKFSEYDFNGKNPVSRTVCIFFHPAEKGWRTTEVKCMGKICGFVLSVFYPISAILYGCKLVYYIVFLFMSKKKL
jgi:hypothetical protein